jgi:subtilisin family serine protease
VGRRQGHPEGPADSQVREPERFGRGVHVYIIDSGINVDHHQLRSQATNDFDYSSNVPKGDCHGHGTHIAGIIGGTQSGVAPEAQLHSVRVVNCEGKGKPRDLAAGLRWVSEKGRRPGVVNISLRVRRTEPDVAMVDSLIGTLISRGFTVVAGSGNDDEPACDYSPAHLPEVITVAASTRKDMRWGKSNYGPCVDLFAPGHQIVSASHSNLRGVRRDSGTSMAAALTTGVAARFLQERPNASPDEVARYLLTSATKEKIKKPEKSASSLLYLDPEMRR